MSLVKLFHSVAISSIFWNERTTLHPILGIGEQHFVYFNGKFYSSFVINELIFSSHLCEKYELKNLGIFTIIGGKKKKKLLENLRL